MNEKFLKIINHFKKTSPARVLIAQAFKELWPKGIRNWIPVFVLSIVAFSFASKIGFSSETVKNINEITDKLIDIQLAVFACIFGVYSLLITFFSDSLIKRFAVIEDEDKSMLEKLLIYFESIIFLYFLNIGFSIILFIFSSILSESASFRLFLLSGNWATFIVTNVFNCSTIDWLKNFLFLDDYLATTILLVYLEFTFLLFYEIKSFIYNIIVMFRAGFSFRFLDFCKEEKEKKGDNTGEKEETK